MNNTKKAFSELARQVLACYAQKNTTLASISGINGNFSDLDEKGGPIERAKDMHQQIKIFSEAQKKLRSNILKAQKLSIPEDLSEPDIALAVWFLRWYESETKVQEIKKSLYLEEFAHIVFENTSSEDFQENFEADVTLADDGKFEETINKLHEALIEKTNLQKKVQNLIEIY